MLGKQMGTKINEAFLCLEDIIISNKTYILEIQNIIRASTKDPLIANKANEILAEISERIDDYNLKIQGVIYGVRSREDGYPYEDICLALEGCYISNYADTMHNSEAEFKDGAKELKKSLSLENVQKMRQMVYNAANEGFNRDVLRELAA